MENAKGVFGKIRELYSNATKSANVGSRNVISILCGSVFKITVVISCLVLIVALICALVIVSPLIVFTMHKKWKAERQDQKEAMERKLMRQEETDWSGKSVDEILREL